MKKVSLREFDEKASDAFRWTYFDPEGHGKLVIGEHENQLNDDLSQMPDAEQERYVANYKKYFAAWLHACSHCASSAITGGSGFQVRRAEKANASERRHAEEFAEWRDRALAAIACRIEENKPEEQKRDETWELLQADIIRLAGIIRNITLGTEYGGKSHFVSLLYNKVETHANHGDVELVQRAIDCIRNFNETTCVVITERHRFFKLAELAEARRKRNDDNAKRANSEIQFPGGTVVQNRAENRIQIVFAQKPDRDVIDLLKKNAFKWSPKAEVWQRQNTNNAIYAVKTILQFLVSKT